MGNQALNPCISAIDDGDPEKSRAEPHKPNLVRRLLHLATSESDRSQPGMERVNLGNLVIKEVQESVMDIMKDGLSQNLQDHLLDKIGRYLRPIDGPPQKKRLFNVSHFLHN